MRALSVGISPTAAVDTTVYTCPTGYYSKFTVMYIHNTGGSTKYITVQWFDASANTTIDILTQYDFSAKTYLQFDGNAYIVLEEGDILKATSESASTFAVAFSIEEEGLTRT